MGKLMNQCRDSPHPPLADDCLQVDCVAMGQY